MDGDVDSLAAQTTCLALGPVPWPSHPDPATLLALYLTLVAERRRLCLQNYPCPHTGAGAESSAALSRKRGMSQDPAPD